MKRTKIHDMVPADRTVLDDNVWLETFNQFATLRAIILTLTPCPQGNSIPLSGPPHKSWCVWMNNGYGFSGLVDAPS